MFLSLSSLPEERSLEKQKWKYNRKASLRFSPGHQPK
jgi:hypothetical protein